MRAFNKINNPALLLNARIPCHSVTYSGDCVVWRLLDLQAVLLSEHAQWHFPYVCVRQRQIVERNTKQSTRAQLPPKKACDVSLQRMRLAECALKEKEQQQQPPSEPQQELDTRQP